MYIFVFLSLSSIEESLYVRRTHWFVFELYNELSLYLCIVVYWIHVYGKCVQHVFVSVVKTHVAHNPFYTYTIWVSLSLSLTLTLRLILWYYHCKCMCTWWERVSPSRFSGRHDTTAVESLPTTLVATAAAAAAVVVDAVSTAVGRASVRRQKLETGSLVGSSS